MRVCSILCQARSHVVYIVAVSITAVDVRTVCSSDVIVVYRFGWNEETRSLTTTIHQPQQTMDECDHNIYGNLKI